MWDLPRPGLEPVSPALAGGFLTTAPPGKSFLHFRECKLHRLSRASLSCYSDHKGQRDAKSISVFLKIIYLFIYLFYLFLAALGTWDLSLRHVGSSLQKRASLELWRAGFSLL